MKRVINWFKAFHNPTPRPVDPALTGAAFWTDSARFWRENERFWKGQEVIRRRLLWGWVIVTALVAFVVSTRIMAAVAGG